MSYLDPGDKQEEAEPGSQVLPLTIPSDSSGSDCIPRRSSRVKKPSKAIESQQWNGLIPAPGAKARARALNAKKKKNMVVSQVADDWSEFCVYEEETTGA